MNEVKLSGVESYTVFKSLLKTSKAKTNKDMNYETFKLLKKFWDNCDSSSKKDIINNVHDRIRMEFWGLTIGDLPNDKLTPFDVLFDENVRYASWEVDRDLTPTELTDMHFNTINELSNIRADIYTEINSLVTAFNVTNHGDFDGDVLNEVWIADTIEKIRSKRSDEDEVEIVAFKEVTHETVDIAIRRLKLFGIDDELIESVKDDIEALAKLYKDTVEKFK